jgi:hypothetical protein
MHAGKTVRRLGVGFALALFLLVAPMPQLEFVEQAVAATVDLPPADAATPEEMAEVQAAADEPLGEDRVQATEEATEEFSLMAVVFDTPPDEPVMVRVDDGAGNWGDWRELHVADDEGPDDPTNYGTEPFWVGASQAYEVNLDAEDSGDAAVVLVRNELRRTVAVTEEVAGASIAPPFGVNPRSAWGARAVAPIAQGSTIRKAIVHHTVSGNSYSQAQVPGVIAGIQAYHIDGRGWSDIGYNFVVDKYGGVWEARDGSIAGPSIGAHAAGFNTNTVGISVLGDYTSVGPSAAAIEGVSRVAGWRLFTGGQEPTANSEFTSAGGPRYAAGTVVNIPNVVGHQDVGSTGCPGSIQSALPQIRQRAQDWANLSKALSGPIGVVDGYSSSGSTIAASGWVTDLDASGPTQVRLDAGGRSGWASANLYRPDVQAVNPSYPSSTGFYVQATDVPPGFQEACVWGVNQNQGQDKLLGCRILNVADPTGRSPVGSISSMNPFPGGFEMSGTVSDADGPVGAVNVEIDGQAVSGAALSGNSWSARLSGIVGGTRRICAVAANTGPGVDTRFDCNLVGIPGGSPWGNLDSVTVNGRYVTLWGWAFDPEAPGPTQVNITLDGRHQWPTPASVPRPEIVPFFPFSDARKGYRFEMNVGPGTHTVCAVAMNTGLGSSRTLGCQTVVIK